MTIRGSTTLMQRLATVALALMLAACATTGGSKEQVVRQRAHDRAQAFLKNDFERSYALLTPSYRKLRAYETWRRTLGAGAAWQSAEVTNVACEEQRCVVQLKVGVKPLIPGRFNDTITVQFEETWLLEDGAWWLHQAN